jgi:hypothetical protein
MKWISVKDKFPEENGNYLIYDGECEVARFKDNIFIELYPTGTESGPYTKGRFRQEIKPTHWMPLPIQPIDKEEIPDTNLIDSMAMRYRHDFGLLNKDEQNAIRTTMKQLWEEVVGLGFYQEKNNPRAIINVTPSGGAMSTKG